MIYGETQEVLLVDRKNTAEIIEGVKCRDCGWPVVSACCNYSFVEFKDEVNWDWWLYCSNKGCKNHDGDGFYQDRI